MLTDGRWHSADEWMRAYEAHLDSDDCAEHSRVTIWGAA